MTLLSRMTLRYWVVTVSMFFFLSCCINTACKDNVQTSNDLNHNDDKGRLWSIIVDDAAWTNTTTNEDTVYDIVPTQSTKMNNPMSLLYDPTEEQAMIRRVSPRKVSLSRRSLSKISSNSRYCVYNASSLRNAIEAAPDDKESTTDDSSTLIDICVPIIRLYYPITVSKKRITIVCNEQQAWGSSNTTNRRCVLDGQNKYRWFESYDANIVFKGIDFVRAATTASMDYYTNVAPFYSQNTILSMIQTTFRKNSIPYNLLVNITSNKWSNKYPAVNFRNVAFESNNAVRSRVL
jgi:hypothetical protein